MKRNPTYPSLILSLSLGTRPFPAAHDLACGSTPPGDDARSPPRLFIYSQLEQISDLLLLHKRTLKTTVSGSYWTEIWVYRSIECGCLYTHSPSRWCVSAEPWLWWKWVQSSVTTMTMGQPWEVPSMQVSLCLVLKHTGSYADFHPVASCDNTHDEKWRVLDSESMCWGRGRGEPAVRK